MTEPNKIKLAEVKVDSRSQSFQDFILSLRDSRHQRPLPELSASLHAISHTPSNISQLSQPPYSQQDDISSREPPMERSMPYSPLSSTQPLSLAPQYMGDAALRIKSRIAPAGRYVPNKYQLPTRCFLPVQQQLQMHLRSSRVQPSSAQLDFNESVKEKQKVQIVPAKLKQAQNRMIERREEEMVKGRRETRRLGDAEGAIVLKYCLLNRLVPSSSVKEIVTFFGRLLQLIGHPLNEPKIQKYRDCIYFGSAARKNLSYEGLLYYFAGRVYLGELVNQRQSGHGVLVDLGSGTVSRGQFKDGQMRGYFQISGEEENYQGEVQDGLYHGHGRLVSADGVHQGYFLEGVFQGPSKVRKQQSTQRYGHSRPQKDVRNEQDSYYQRKGYSSGRTANRQREFSRSQYLDINKKIKNSKYYEDMDPFEEQQPEREDRYRERPRQKQVCRDFSYALAEEAVEQPYNPQKVPRRLVRDRDVIRVQRKRQRMDSQSQEEPLAAKC